MTDEPIDLKDLIDYGAVELRWRSIGAPHALSLQREWWHWPRYVIGSKTMRIAPLGFVVRSSTHD